MQQWACCLLADQPKEDAELKKLQGTWVAAKGGAHKGKEESEEDIKRAGHRLGHK